MTRRLRSNISPTGILEPNIIGKNWQEVTGRHRMFLGPTWASPLLVGLAHDAFWFAGEETEIHFRRRRGLSEIFGDITG
jgi:hypothetical protein